MKQVAIVGFGFMGMTHLAALLKLHGVRVVAIVDKDVAGIADKLTSKTGNFETEAIDPDILASLNTYDSIDTCLEQEELDAVHVCVHTDLHFEVSMKLLSKGLDVFLEKPMTLDIERGEDLIKLAEQNDCILMVGHVVRFMPPYQQLKEWFDTKTYGDLKFLSLSRYSGVPLWGQWKEKQTAFGSSGGALFDFLIHDIDFANYLLGTPENIRSTVLPGYLSDNDYVSAFWEYKDSDVSVKVEGGNVFHSTYPFQATFSAQFEKASVFFSTLQPEAIQVASHEEVTRISLEDAPDGFENEINYFYDCVGSRKPPEVCLPASSLETIRLCYRHQKNEK